MEHSLKRGDIVAAVSEQYPLHCGSGIYSHAIVVQAEPLVLVSESSDMRWGRVPATRVHKIGDATPEQLAVCDRRLIE